jgi:hypothetical protein
VVLLPDMDDARGLARLLKDVQLPNQQGAATFVVPPVLAKPFFADQRVQSDVDRWWASAVPCGYIPVYLAMHEEDLDAWLKGLNALAYVGLPRNEAAEHYTDMAHVEYFLAGGPLDFATVIMRDFSGSRADCPILFDRGEALRMAALASDFPIDLDDSPFDFE